MEYRKLDNVNDIIINACKREIENNKLGSDILEELRNRSLLKEDSGLLISMKWEDSLCLKR